jgi:hypothetical protein
MTPSEEIIAMIGKPYDEHQGACWDFCRKVSLILGKEIPNKIYSGFVRVDEPKQGTIVLFQLGKNWHSGIIWPDGLHFLHASPKHKSGGEYVVRKERLTLWPWDKLVEGFYEYVG